LLKVEPLEATPISGAIPTKNCTALVTLVAIAITSIAARQLLMPAINAATDSNNKKRFALLHGASVVLTLAHIAALAVLLARFV
jgi:cbb3-type cytochrome oxidase subunit 1